MNWQRRIIEEFPAGVAPLTLVADPDRLLLQVELQREITERGFEILVFEDPIMLRHVYEQRYHPPQGDVGLVVIVVGEVNDLPFDLLENGRRLAFSLAQFFPHLATSVLDSIDSFHLDDLQRACERFANQRMGEVATRDFVLHHVFALTPDLVTTPADLIRFLLRLHSRSDSLPALLQDRIIELLKQVPFAHDQLIYDLVQDRTEFYRWLQAEWEEYVQNDLRSLSVPFDDAEIRSFVDTLFLQGTLHPVDVADPSTIVKTWAAVGIVLNDARMQQARVERLMAELEKSLPAEDSRWTAWGDYAYTWAELGVAWPRLPAKASESLGGGLQRVRDGVDARFEGWVRQRFATLHNQPPMPPVMVHHIARSLARLHELHSGKLALVVLDGMAINQWLILRSVLQRQCPGLIYQEDAVFAWVPTVTCVSRQAIFAGKPPWYFARSIDRTDREEALWKQFWIEQDVAPERVFFAKGLRAPPLDPLLSLVENPRCELLGLVVDKIDVIMHGMTLGTAGMQNQVELWAETGYMANLLTLLIQREFEVFLTADHGNVEARGIGSPAEGAMADTRGERVRIYPHESLRAMVHSSFPESIPWDPIGLPSNYLPLIAPARTAFVGKGETVVCHGGINLEEMIVPFIRVEEAQHVTS